MILIVDDNPNIVKLISFKLGKEGFKYRTASTGNEAWSAVKAKKPEIMILDVVLPDIIGYDLCEQLKNDPEYASISIIILSVKNTLEDKYKGLKSGAEDYITKPFNPDELLLRIRRIIDNKHQLEMWQEEFERISRKFIAFRKRSKKKLEKERVSAINEIAISINHEINNPLCTIIGNAELLLREFEYTDINTKNKLKSIINESLRIQEVTWRLANIIKPLSVDYYRNLKMIDVHKSEIKTFDSKPEGEK